MRTFFLSFTVFLIAAAAAPAVDQTDPKAVAAAYWDAMKEGDYGTATALFDETALKDFREMLSFLEDPANTGASAAIQQFFGPEATSQSLAALTDPEYFEKFLSAVMGFIGGEVNFEKMEILGAVEEGENLRHFVTRMHLKAGEITMEGMQVVTVRKSGDKWGVMLEGKMKGLAENIKQSLGQ